MEGHVVLQAVRGIRGSEKTRGLTALEPVLGKDLTTKYTKNGDCCRVIGLAVGSTNAKSRFRTFSLGGETWYAEGVSQQSPGSRSAPWECTGQSPANLYAEGVTPGCRETPMGCPWLWRTVPRVRLWRPWALLCNAFGVRARSRHDLDDPAVAAIGDIEDSPGADGHAVRLAELGVGGRTTEALGPFPARAGQGGIVPSAG